MSMSSHVLGVRDLDGRFAKMMQAKLACESAGVGYPQEVTDYFKFPREGEEYRRKEMESVDISQAVTKFSRDGTDGFQVELSNLPDCVKSVRFTNSY